MRDIILQGKAVLVLIMLTLLCTPVLGQRNTSDQSMSAADWNNEGNCLADQGILTGSIQAYDKAIEINPQYAEALHNKAVVLNNIGVDLDSRGKYDDAVKTLDKAIEVSSQLKVAWNNKGVVLYHQGKYDEADVTFAKAKKVLYGASQTNAQFQINAANISKISNGNNQFALDMFSQIGGGQQQENVVFSPWSIYSALAMAYDGAKGNTAQEIQQAMHFPAGDSLVKQSFGSAYDKFNAKDVGYNLSIANALWAWDIDHTPLLDSFTSDMNRYYHGTVKNVDFKGAPEATAKMINSWSASATNNKITNIISPDDIIPLMQLGGAAGLIITNAAYFKGKWDNPFDESMTAPKNFAISSGKIIKTSMMGYYELRSFNYKETRDMQMIELPYQGNKVSMIVLLPKDKNTSSLEKSLSSEKLETWRKTLSMLEANASIPKFSFKEEYTLTGILKSIGINTAFTPFVADFSGINGVSGDSNKGLFIADMRHLACIDVNEKETEAAAAGYETIPGGADVSAGFDHRCWPPYPEIIPVVFNANHPFVFLIQDVETGTILFMGKVNDPTNVATPNKTAEIMTKNATMEPSGAEKVAEKPAPKQPGFEGILAVMGILAMGYIRLVRKQ